MFLLIYLMLENNVESDIKTGNILAQPLPKVRRSYSKEARKKQMEKERKFNGYAGK